MVAQGDGFFDGLEADAVFGEAGDRQGAGDRAGREDELVVGQFVAAGAFFVGCGGAQGDGAFGVVDRGGLADDDLAFVQQPP